MIVYVFQKFDDGEQKIYNSFKNGKSRFGWSIEDKHNLKLKDNWSEWHSANLFLLNIKKGDWIVHVNTPFYGKCIAGKVIKEYDFDEGFEIDGRRDGRHVFEIDKSTIIEFDRNADAVHPKTSKNLKPRMRWQRAKAQKEFEESIKNLKNPDFSIKGDKGEYYLKKALFPFYIEVSKKLHNTHPSKKLEYFIEKIFKNIPNVTNTKVNGSRWGTDNGADVIVNYNSGLDITGLEEQKTMVVQIKSYEGKHWNTEAVDQIKDGIDHFSADAGMLITTAESTPVIEEAIENLSKDLKTPIVLIAGANIAKFILKYGRDLLFDI